MADWIMSANEKYFDHYSAFLEQGFIDWKQTRNYGLGDCIYIFCTKPTSRIKFVTEVIDVNMTYSEISNQNKYWRVTPQEGNRYCRLKLLATIDDERASYEYLTRFGMKYIPQSPSHPKQELLEVLQNIWRNQ